MDPELTVTEDAHAAIRAALNASGATVLIGVTTEQDAILAALEAPVRLNVVKSVERPQVLGEQLGLGEDDVVLEWVQTFNVEVLVVEADADVRNKRFSAVLKAIEAALYADRTLGGKAAGLNLGSPGYDADHLAGGEDTSACFIPVRVSLRGLSMIS